MVDTNCSPEGIDYLIPGNDDAMRAIQLYASGIADAVLEGNSTVVEMPVGEDEFVELDEEGKPRAAPVHRSRPARLRPARRPPPVPSACRSTTPRPPSSAPKNSSKPIRKRALKPSWPGVRLPARRSRPLRLLRCSVLTLPRPSRLRRPRPKGLIMSVTAEAVKALRERTGAGMMECKKALVETNGDLDAAAEIMRKSGLAKADKKAGRVAAEGVVVVERTADGKRAAVVEVNSETDFVAREKDFQGFAADVAKAALNAQPADLEALLATKLASRQDGRGNPPRTDRPHRREHRRASL